MHVHSLLLLQFAPVVGDFAAEKQRNLDILGKITSKKPILNVTKAVNAHIGTEEKRSAQRVALWYPQAILNVIFDVVKGASRKPGQQGPGGRLRGRKWEARQTSSPNQDLPRSSRVKL